MADIFSTASFSLYLNIQTIFLVLFKDGCFDNLINFKLTIAWMT